MGTDAALMERYLPYMGWKWKLKIAILRRILLFLDRFAVRCIYVDDTILIGRLRAAGFKSPIFEVPDPVNHPAAYERREHEGINVLYYDPSEHRKNKETARWIYGIDYIEKAMQLCSGLNVNWIKVDGNQDMSKIYPITDLYVRPNRIDAKSRMVQECEINGIPVYHTKIDMTDSAQYIYWEVKKLTMK